MSAISYNLPVRQGASDYTLFGFSNYSWGDVFQAEVNGTIASAGSDTPLDQLIQQGNNYPFPFPTDQLKDVMTDYGIEIGTTENKTGRSASYDCETGTCSDGQPPNYTDTIRRWLNCNIATKAERDRLMCGEKFNPNDVLKSDGQGTLGGSNNPFGGLWGSTGNPFGDILGLGDTKSAGIWLLGLIVLAFGIYAFVKQ